MNHHQFLHEMLQPSNFDLTSSHEDFLEQMLSSMPPTASSFLWAGDHPQEDQSAALLASRMRHRQISAASAKALMLQQQLLLSMHVHNDVVDESIANPEKDKSILNAFTGSASQNSNQSQHLQGGALQQSPDLGGAAGAASGEGAAGGRSRR